VVPPLDVLGVELDDQEIVHRRADMGRGVGATLTGRGSGVGSRAASAPCISHAQGNCPLPSRCQSRP
jgi:hypothetical protein